MGAKVIEEMERAKTGAQSQVESLKSRMLLYVDYDEIKRELDIMKVGGASFFLFFFLNRGYDVVFPLPRV